jgi:hypothetical protein
MQEQMNRLRAEEEALQRRIKDADATKDRAFAQICEAMATRKEAERRLNAIREEWRVLAYRQARESDRS